MFEPSGHPEDVLNAWSDYRSKQDQIVDYLLRMCEIDSDLGNFVKSQALETIQTNIEPFGCSLPQAHKIGFNAFPTAPPDHKEPVALFESLGLSSAPVGSLTTSTQQMVSDDALMAWMSTPTCLQASDKAEMPSDDAVALLARLMEEDEFEATSAEGQISLLNRIMGNKTTSTGNSIHQFGDTGKDGEASEVLSTVVWWLGIRRLTTTGALDYLTCNCGIVAGREIDFFYCPSDFAKPYIKGYAILNFRDIKKAEELVQSVPECSWAKVQGLALNSSRFLKRHGHIRNTRFRPLVWPSADDTSPTCLWDPNGPGGSSGPSAQIEDSSCEVRRAGTPKETFPVGARPVGPVINGATLAQ